MPGEALVPVAVGSLYMVGKLGYMWCASGSLDELHVVRRHYGLLKVQFWYRYESVSGRRRYDTRVYVYV